MSIPSSHLKRLGVLLVLMTAITVPLLRLTGPPGQYRAGDLRHNLVLALKTRHGLDVQPTDLLLPEGDATGLSPVRVYFLGRRPAEGPRDLYFTHFILSQKAIPVHASPLFALTETKMADECEMQLDADKRFLAYASAIKGKTSVVTILDLRGLRSAELDDFSSRERLQQHLTNWQETGVWDGIGRVKVQLTVPQRVRLSWTGHRLQITNPRGTWTALVDPGAAKVLSGPARATRIPVPRRNFVAWAVDTVRNFSFVGNERIAWLEDLVFGMVDRARRMSGAAVTATDIKDEMDLPVVRRKTAKIAGWPPKRLRPILRDPLKGEGRWVEVEGPFVRTEPGMPSFLAATFLRPDPERLFSRIYFIAWDPRRLDLRMVAGLRNPTSATGLRGPGKIPPKPKLLRRLVAAFNGGFQSTHGDFGMVVGGKVYAPAKPWAATVARLKDGSTGLGTWDGKLPFGFNPGWIHSFRQNLTALVEDGKFNPWRRGSWGGGSGFLTGKGAKAHTWRSGLCLHESGHLFYLLGNPIDGPTLGKTMQRVGCTYGMELDINVTHVGMEYLNVRGPQEKDPPGASTFKNRKYFSKRGSWAGVEDHHYFMRVAIRGTGNMPFPRWTGRADEREFFYLVKRSLLPRADLRPLGAQPREGRWTSATLPERALAFPQLMARTVLHPDSAQADHKVHLFQLDARFLEASLCVPSSGSDCLPRKGDRQQQPLAILPLGTFGAGRALLADGRPLGEQAGAGSANYLNLAPLRPQGPALAAVGAQPAREPGSISIQGASAADGVGLRRTVALPAALCPGEEGVLLYATGLGVTRANLERALRHAGCQQVVHLGQSAPLVLVRNKGLTTALGQMVPPTATTPSLVLRRSNAAWGERIFSHVKPQPRRVWTVAQPEFTRSSAVRRANRIAKELGLPKVKRVDDLCRPPFSEHKELRRLRWRDPVTGAMCGEGFKPRVKIHESFQKLIKKRRKGSRRRPRRRRHERQHAPR